MKSYGNIKGNVALDTTEFEGDVVFEVLDLTEKGNEERQIIEWKCVYLWGSNPEQTERFTGKEFVVPFFFGKDCSITVSQLNRFFRASGFDT